MKRMLAGLAMITLAATGCGGGSAKPAADKVASSPSAGESRSAAPVGVGNLSGDCLKAAEEFSKSSQAFSPTNGNSDPASSFAKLGDRLKALKQAVSDQKVKDALDVLATAYSKLGESLKGVNYKPGSGQAPPAAYLAAIRSLGDAKFAAAGQVLSSYFGTACHK